MALMTQIQVANLLEDLNTKSGVYASLDAATNTTTTDAGTWYPLAGAFTNDFDNFSFVTDHIEYDGDNDYEFEIDWQCSQSSDTATTVAHVTVKINTTVYTESQMGTLLKNVNQPYAYAGTLKVMLTKGDEIQIVVSSDKAGAVLTTHHFTTSMNKFYEKRG
jgi:hypothetical protein